MGALISLLPLILRLANWLLDKGAASAETKRRMLALIESAADDGLISVQAKDNLNAQRKRIEEQIAADQANSNGGS